MSSGSSGLLLFLLFICLPSGQTLKGSAGARRTLVDLPSRPGRVARRRLRRMLAGAVGRQNRRLRAYQERNVTKAPTALFRVAGLAAITCEKLKPSSIGPD